MPVEKRSNIITLEDHTALVEGVTNGTTWRFGGFKEALLIGHVTATTGAGQTLDIKVQYSPDGVNWVDSGDAFVQFDATVGAMKIKRLTSVFGDYIRLVMTISAGDTYTFKVYAIAKTF